MKWQLNRLSAGVCPSLMMYVGMTEFFHPKVEIQSTQNQPGGRISEAKSHDKRYRTTPFNRNDHNSHFSLEMVKNGYFSCY